MHLEALHGFLGLPSDWDFFQKSFSVTAHDLTEFSPKEGLQAFGKIFNEKIKSQPIHDKRVLAGYSLGGRLALHALMQAPSCWDAAVIISAHPGLQSEEAKNERLQQDHKWAKKVLEMPWNEFLADWNGQSVFKGKECIRHEESYCKQSLANVFQFWSLALQGDLRKAIQQLSMPILWVVGEEDRKFLTLARELSFQHPQSRVVSVPDSSHRVLFDQPEDLKTAIKAFLLSI